MGSDALPDALPQRERHRPRGEIQPSKRGRWRALVLVLVHIVAALHIAHWLGAGNTLGPLEPSESGETLVTGAINAGFVFFVLLILSTLIFGRFFCGWACHVVALQDLCAWLLGKLGLRPRPLRSRLLALVPIFAAIEMFVLPSVLRPEHDTSWAGLSLELTTNDFWGRFPGLWIALATFAVDGFLIVWWLGAKSFCTYGCPYGAVFGAVDRFARGRIRVTDACEGCGHCTATCSSNVRVHEEVARYGMVVDTGCMKCLDCVDVCPKDALYFGFGDSRGAALSAAKSKPQRKWDLGWPEEVLAALLFAGGLYATRNLYDRVPFLLAIGLSVIVAVAGVVGVRLVRQRDFTFQHRVLRSHGRWTTSGALGLGLAAAILGFAGHSGLVQHHDRAATNALERASVLAPGSPGRTAAIDDALEHLERFLAVGFVETASAHARLGQIRGARGDFERAVEHARRAIELEPERLTPRLQLAEIALLRGAPAGAIAPLREVLELTPAHAGATLLLKRVIGADVELLDAHVLLAGALLAQGDTENARRGLDWVLERAPDHAGALELRAK